MNTNEDAGENLICESHGDVLVVSLQQEDVDIDCPESTVGRIFLAFGETTKIVLDLTEVQFIGSYGVGMLLRMIQQAGTSGLAFKFCGLSEPVSQALELVHVSRLIDIYDTREQAIYSFQRLG
ncbi:MAG: STAS domain-containing protein [Phycisphaerae bacterium]|nr:STAS domain-containing protein [Phycisphaerae bacterium]